MEGQNPHANDSYAVPPILKQYWHTAVRWRWLIGAVIAGALAIGLIITLLTPSSYTAKVQIEISRDQKKVTNVQGLDSATADRDLEFYETQYALLQSRSLGQRVAKHLGLARRDEFFTAHGVTLDSEKFGASGRSNLTAKQVAAREKMASRLLLNNIEVEPVRRSRLVNLTYTSRSPGISAEVVNAWSTQFIAASMDRQLASTADARSFLEERLANLRARMEQSERDVVSYASRNDIVTLDTSRGSDGKTQVQRTMVASDLEALNAALNMARADRIAAESRLSARGGDDNVEAITNPTIAQIRQKRADIASEYAKMIVRFEPNYPSAKALMMQIKSLDEAIARETARVGNSRSLSYQEAVKRENDLRDQVAALKGRLDKQQHDAIQYNIYQREADTNRQLYDALLQRYKEIGIAGSVGVSNIVVVDQADVPSAPSAPSLPKNMALALVIGLGMAVVATLGLEQIDEGVSHPGQIQQLFHLPMLGHVPLTDASVAEGIEDPKSYFSEAYFTIRSNLAFTTDHGLPRSFIVTSTQPAEGKSTTSYALARIIGRTGKSVLLVDGDMRSPDVHHLLGLDNAAGLSNALAGDDNVSALIRTTPYRGVSVLTSGPTPPSAAELLSSDRIRHIVNELQGLYDHVVIDAPPILGLSDAPLLGRAVEGAVLVIQAEGAAVRGIRAAISRLRMVNTHIFGTVLTKLKASELAYGYGYGYGYGYSYGDNAENKAA
ncbi:MULTISPECIES: GumC family protein [unclassified Sphingomonas]|nr:MULTISPECIES: polysaccharide biosynthesis tyrosine autokinase [unclassified Sphingomonas]KQX19530.1 protein tyrosine kinase [Sphingomonas sp. Root1294]KQY65731.1 protein tyrosine kinase [Sphingomonas sp. Root50]KRB94964.1 protein tyrosine kinase [Sphingomonas sp. Root720]